MEGDGQSQQKTMLGCVTDRSKEADCSLSSSVTYFFLHSSTKLHYGKFVVQFIQRAVLKILYTEDKFKTRVPTTVVFVENDIRIVRNLLVFST